MTQQRMTNEQLADATNPQLAELVRRCVAERQALGELYGRSGQVVLLQLFSFAAHCATPLHQITKRDVRAWLADLDVANSTRGTYLSSLKAFCKWLAEEDIIAHNPTFGVRVPRPPRGEKRSLSNEEVDRLFNVLPDARAWAIVSLMIGEGLRAGEVSRLRTHDVDLCRRLVHVRGKGYKGQRSRTIPLTIRSHDAVAEYLAAERHIVSGPLIRSAARGGEHEGLAPGTVGSLVSGWLDAAGVKHAPGDGISAHSLRHTAAEHIDALTDDIRQVQTFLGHANLATTQAYLRNEVKGLAELQAMR